MKTKKLLNLLLNIMGDSKDYFITGSLSFLSLCNYYRNPIEDIDICIKKDTYKLIKNKFLKIGKIEISKVSDVGIINKTKFAKLIAPISPMSGFLHIKTKYGILDVVLFNEHKKTIELMLGLGFTFSMSKSFK